MDASALLEVLLQTARSRAIVQTVANADMVAPDLINVEVLSALRRMVLRQELSAPRADEAVEDLRDAPVRRLSTLPLIAATWTLRHNLSAYDACYVALAVSLDCPLLSADARLARASQLPIAVIVP